MFQISFLLGTFRANDYNELQTVNLIIIIIACYVYIFIMLFASIIR